MSEFDKYRAECDQFEVTLMTTITACAVVMFALVAAIAFGVL